MIVNVAALVVLISFGAIAVVLGLTAQPEDDDAEPESAPARPDPDWIEVTAARVESYQKDGQHWPPTQRQSRAMFAAAT